MTGLKVYFACSIRGGGDKSSYTSLIEAIQEEATLLTEVFAKDALLPQGSPLPNNQIYRRDVDWMDECDVAIVDVSNPSLGVGYEIGYLEKINKPTLALYREAQDKKLSAMVAGNPKIELFTYTDIKDAKNKISEWLKQQS